jgi:hypothetical protein
MIDIVVPEEDDSSLGTKLTILQSELSHLWSILYDGVPALPNKAVDDYGYKTLLENLNLNTRYMIGLVREISLATKTIVWSLEE